MKKLLLSFNKNFFHSVLVLLFGNIIFSIVLMGLNTWLKFDPVTNEFVSDQYLYMINWFLAATIFTVVFFTPLSLLVSMPIWLLLNFFSLRDIEKSKLSYTRLYYRGFLIVLSPGLLFSLFNTINSIVENPTTKYLLYNIPPPIIATIIFSFVSGLIGLKIHKNNVKDRAS